MPWARGANHHVKTSFEDARVTFHIRPTRDPYRCSHCGGDNCWSQGSVPRTLRTVPIGNKPTYNRLDVPRIYCFLCQKTRQVRLASPLLERAILARLSGVPWTCRVTRLQKYPIPILYNNMKTLIEQITKITTLSIPKNQHDKYLITSAFGGISGDSADSWLVPCFHWLNAPAQTEQIMETERQLGYPIPDEYKQFLSVCNGAKLFTGAPI
jgi:hypothetical protein